MKKIFSLMIMGLLIANHGITKESFVFDNTIYNQILSQYVQNERVDYTALKDNRGPLDAYVKSLGELTKEEYESMTDEEKIAFLLNAYNAITLKVIIDHYPIKPSGFTSLFVPKNSIRQIPGAWDKITHPVAGEEITLDHLEHGIMRVDFSEPRIHFGLVCASIGCPDLRTEAFVGSKLDEQLNDQVQKFFSDPTKFRYDAESNTLHVSEIFKWFKEDFDVSGGIQGFAKTHLNSPKANQISSKTKVKYLSYDWSLNDL